jgi:enamine deaminase RidA (YjgF/YER057c/UK114 family)
MGKRKSFHIDGWHPGQPIPVASQIGNVIITGLVTANDPLTRVFAPDAPAQIEQMFTNLEAVLGAAGATFEDVVRVTVYVTDRSIREHLNPVWIRYFPDEHARPARATMPVDELLGGALIQCEAMVVLS